MVMRWNGSWLGTLATFGVLLSLGACGGSSVAGSVEASGGREGDEDGHTAPPASTGTPGEPTPTHPTPVAVPVPSGAPPGTEPNPISSATPAPSGTGRSEEHTSELQSPCNLVCRLLLEKKK